jgi:hypothetical protein
MLLDSTGVSIIQENSRFGMDMQVNSILILQRLHVCIINEPVGLDGTGALCYKAIKTFILLFAFGTSFYY